MTTRSRSLAAATLVTALGFAGPSIQAHEFWVQPSSFQPSPQSPLGVSLRVGDDLEGVAVARRADHTVRFDLSSDLVSPITGREGGTPAGFVRVARPGLHVIAYESRHSRIEIDADRFENYLVDKGLETVAEARAQAGDSDRPGRERYARCAKALVAVGSGEGADRAVGLPLELVAVDNPYRTAAGRPLRLRLLHQGKPLSGALVKAWQAGVDDALSARTDADGRVSMHFEGTGMWLVSAVHMIPAGGWRDAEWESYWASLTFERRGPVE